MCRIATFILSIAPAVVFAAGTAVTFTTNEPIALPSSEALALFKQCSRHTPTPDKVLEAPSANEVAAIEAHVVQYIAELSKSGKRVPPAGIYARQYVSFMEGGKRKIYGNFFPQSVARGSAYRSAVIVCDGGAKFWGIVYDPEHKAIIQLEMNGDA
jgi:hypothetical protein